MCGLPVWSTAVLGCTEVHTSRSDRTAIDETDSQLTDPTLTELELYAGRELTCQPSALHGTAGKHRSGKYALLGMVGGKKERE